jgi:hypothetical protein
MKRVVLTRDLKPWQANHTTALPDDVADKMIAAGEARLAPPGEDGIVLAPDASPAKPRNRYLTRGARA